MIPKQFASQQILRTSGLRFFPSSQTAIDELIDALRQAAKDESEAREAITSWIRNNREAPTPYDLYELSRKHPPATLPAEKRYTNGYDPNAEFQEWANKHVLRRVK